MYDVTSLFNSAGNSMTITPEGGNNYALYGAYLIVVYQDPKLVKRRSTSTMDSTCSTVELHAVSTILKEQKR